MFHPRRRRFLRLNRFHTHASTRSGEARQANLLLNLPHEYHLLSTSVGRKVAPLSASGDVGIGVGSWPGRSLPTSGVGSSEIGAGVTGAGVTGAGVIGAGVTGAGVTGAGVTGAGVTGATVGASSQVMAMDQTPLEPFRPLKPIFFTALVLSDIVKVSPFNPVQTEVLPETVSSEPSKA